jgi:predicted DNA-binding transcriptional regulator
VLGQVIMDDIQKIKEEINLIKERNKRVELDKKWEGSYTRKILLILFTYLAIGFYLRAINISQPWLNAIVPAVAFLLSTLTLPFFKKNWTGYIMAQNKPVLIEIQAKDKEENKNIILDMLESREKITNREVEEGLKVSDATATRYLDELEKEGIIKQVGTDGPLVYYKKI